MLNWEKISLGSGEASTEFAVVGTNGTGSASQYYIFINSFHDRKANRLTFAYQNYPSQSKYMVTMDNELNALNYNSLSLFADTGTSYQRNSGVDWNGVNESGTNYSLNVLTKSNGQTLAFNMDSPVQSPYPGRMHSMSQYMGNFPNWQSSSPRASLGHKDATPNTRCYMMRGGNSQGGVIGGWNMQFSSPSNLNPTTRFARNTNNSTPGGSGFAGMDFKTTSQTSNLMTAHSSPYHMMFAEYNSNLQFQAATSANCNTPSSASPQYFSNFVYDKTNAFGYICKGNEIWEWNVSARTVKIRLLAIPDDTGVFSVSPVLKITSTHLYVFISGIYGDFFYKVALSSSGASGLAGSGVTIRNAVTLNSNKNTMGYDRGYNLEYDEENDQFYYFAGIRLATSPNPEYGAIVIVNAKYDTFSTLGSAGIGVTTSTFNVPTASTYNAGVSYTFTESGNTSVLYQPNYISNNIGYGVGSIYPPAMDRGPIKNL